LLRTTIVLAISSLVLTVGVAIADAPSPYRAVGAGTEIRGLVPTKAEAHAFAGKGGSGGTLTYHGGPVLTTNNTYTIFWAPTNYSIATTYSDGINRYFDDVATASNANAADNVYSVLNQYYDSSNTHIAYSSSHTASYVDTQPYPTSGNCSDNVSQTTVCITDGQIRAELQRLFALPTPPIGSPNAKTTYFVFTAKNVGSCFNSSTCAFSYYCAYHSNLAAQGVTVQYANQPYADTVASACDSGYHPNGSTYPDSDATINVASHEHRESINDPLGNAWFDRRGAEGSDKCAWNFGTLLGSGSTRYNQTINGHNYILQQEWSNSGSTCKLHA
jgi:hypothetical protein